MTVFTDTLGVDFGPYLKDVRKKIATQWQSSVPKETRSPSTVVIQFFIQPDGKVSGMAVTKASGNVDLDRFAWNAIISASPFPPLPERYHGEHLGLRLKFSYEDKR